MSLIQNILKSFNLKMPKGIGLSSPSNISENKQKSPTNYQQTPINYQQPSLIQRITGVAKELPSAIGQTIEQRTWLPPSVRKPVASVMDFMTPQSPEEAAKMGMAAIQSPKTGKYTYIDTFGMSGGLRAVGQKAVTKAAPKVFKGFQDLSTIVLNKLTGKVKTSKAFISDTLRHVEKKQGVTAVEKDLINDILKEFPDFEKVPIKEFANRVKTELLPLKSSKNTRESMQGLMPERGSQGGTLYHNRALPDNLRGNIDNYSERIWTSPIQNTAGLTHYRDIMYNDNYFAHTRIEDLSGDIRRIIEIQSDLFQKGALEKSLVNPYREGGKSSILAKYLPEDKAKRLMEIDKDMVKGGLRIAWEKEFIALREEASKIALKDKKTGYSQLQPFKNDWYKRIIREEVREAAKDGKKVLQFPTGETAVKVEGLGVSTQFADVKTGRVLTKELLKVGNEVESPGGNWIITEVLEDGKFKAISKEQINLLKVKWGNIKKVPKDEIVGFTETFDISGKIDITDPIYKFYENNIQKYLKKIYPEMKQITDPQGVKWWQIDIKPEMAKAPIEAFGVLPFIDNLNKQQEEETQPQQPSLIQRAMGVAKEFPSAIKETTKKPGNIDLNNRPQVKNSDGSISTVRSISINEDGEEILIPTVRQGLDRIMTNQEAMDWYHKTGEHLGKFNTVKEADKYAEQLHQEQEKIYKKHDQIQYQPTNIAKETLQRLSGEIKETTAEELLKLPDLGRKILGIMIKPDYKPIKESIVKNYELTKVASDLWDDAKFELKKSDESMPWGIHYQPVNIASDVISKYVPEKIIEKIPEKAWQKFESLPPKGKALIEIYKQKPEVVLHELGHHFLTSGIMAKDKSNKIIASLTNQWDELNKKENKFTIYIDGVIHDNYKGDSIDPRALLQERYAIMFELAGIYGTQEVPQELKLYIKPFINIKGE
uniref:Putative methyltransferase n=1 Tax=viral metagenome TaxID=1070528 RepID=A0A6M3ILB2_9ZZZZ